MRLPKELERVTIPADKADVVMNRLRPLMRMWPWHVRMEAVEQLALSAYTQGLLDGQQIFCRVPEERT